jgi:hypothetical protein
LVHAFWLTDHAPNGIGDVFEGAVVARIVDTIECIQPRLDTPP